MCFLGVIDAKLAISNNILASKRLRKSPRVHFRRWFASKTSPDLSGREFLCREVVTAYAHPVRVKGRHYLPAQEPNGSVFAGK